MLDSSNRLSDRTNQAALPDAMAGPLLQSALVAVLAHAVLLQRALQLLLLACMKGAPAAAAAAAMHTVLDG
jgi:hypothetical protein